MQHPVPADREQAFFNAIAVEKDVDGLILAGLRRDDDAFGRLLNSAPLSIGDNFKDIYRLLAGKSGRNRPRPIQGSRLPCCS